MKHNAEILDDGYGNKFLVVKNDADHNRPPTCLGFSDPTSIANRLLPGLKKEHYTLPLEPLVMALLTLEWAADSDPWSEKDLEEALKTVTDLIRTKLS